MGKSSSVKFSNMVNPVFSRKREFVGECNDFGFSNGNVKRAKIVDVLDDVDDDDDYSLGFIYRSALKQSRKGKTETYLAMPKVLNVNIGQENNYRMVYGNVWISRESCVDQIKYDSDRMFCNNHWTGQESNDYSQENCYGVAPKLTDNLARMSYDNHWIGQQDSSYGVVTEAIDGSARKINEYHWIDQESEDKSIGQEESNGVASEAIDDLARILSENRCVGQEESCGVATEAIDDLARILSEDRWFGQKSEDRCIGQEESKGVATEAIYDLARILSEDSWVGQKSEDRCIGQEDSCGVATEAIDDLARILSEDRCVGQKSEDRCVGQEEGCGVAPEVECGRIDDSVDCEVDDYKFEPKPEDSKGLGVSLTDSLTADQIREHLRSLMEPNGIVAGENTCKLCAKDRLMFAPPPMDCARCVSRIKPGSICYKTDDELGTQYSFCAVCFNKSRGGRISIKEGSFPKKELIKGNNVAESEEAWVQCDKCQSWQHQICALYNSKHDVDGNMTYICLLCRLTEQQAIKKVSVSPILGARGLPGTILSDHLEQWLSTRLAREREQRAESLGKAVEEVPGAEDLVIRTVLAVDKQIKVKQQFLDILHSEHYPSEFPYKSKVIMLFQEVEGVEVCLFVMYVQEFGSECGEPNQRSVYISYIDSVKYFTPDIKTVTGQALRSFVYHEILIGYLDYCKQRGFNTCYIWACPPVKGDDYILYCHPETQRTPKSEKLRKWYKMMLKKAMEDNVVVEYTNFYDYFFVPKDDQNSKITAARLPYFDGDFWTGAIENMIETIGKNCKGDSKKKKPKKYMTKRTFKSMGHNDLSADAAEDIQVMTTLGHTILPSKDDFFVVHLQFTCINCHELILSRNRWSCNQCKNFHLCERCIKGKKSRDGLRTHTTNRGAKHTLIQITGKDVAANTNDKDIIIDNDIFESRHAFLNFCQENNYQFETLRRAKHSSMMILYYLHKMAVLSTGNICSFCRQDVMNGGWLCGICCEFHVCDSCYQKEGDNCHFHKLSQQLKGSDCLTKTEKVQQNKTVEVKSIMDRLSRVVTTCSR